MVNYFKVYKRFLIVLTHAVGPSGKLTIIQHCSNILNHDLEAWLVRARKINESAHRDKLFSLNLTYRRNLYFLRYKKSNYKKVDLLIFLPLCECDV